MSQTPLLVLLVRWLDPVFCVALESRNHRGFYAWGERFMCVEAGLTEGKFCAFRAANYSATPSRSKLKTNKNRLHWTLNWVAIISPVPQFHLALKWAVWDETVYPFLGFPAVTRCCGATELCSLFPLHLDPVGAPLPWREQWSTQAKTQRLPGQHPRSTGAAIVPLESWSGDTAPSAARASGKCSSGKL